MDRVTSTVPAVSIHPHFLKIHEIWLTSTGDGKIIRAAKEEKKGAEGK
jgi:hypothetical protein